MKQQGPLPTREAASTHQVSVLLAITQALQPYLLEPPRENIPQEGPLDGGTVAAAAATFVKTCAKLDEILSDPSRWNLETSDALYDAAIQTQEAQKEFLQMQTAAAASGIRPSFQLQPNIIYVENGFAAIYGELTTGQVVIGYGPTPEAALADFDLAFQRKPEQQHRYQPAPTPEPTKRKKKK